MKFWAPGTEDPTLDGLPLARSGLYISCAYPGKRFRNSFARSRSFPAVRETPQPNPRPTPPDSPDIIAIINQEGRV